MIRSGLQALILGLLVLAPLGTAQADGLFKDLPAGRATTSADAATTKFPSTVKRSRQVAIDPAYLAARVLPDAPMALGDRAPAKPVPVEMALFPDLTLTLAGRRTEQAADGRTVWTGSVAGSADSLAILVVDGSAITGQIFSGTTVIEIRGTPTGVHTIAEIDQGGFPDKDDVIRDALPTPAPATPPGAQPHQHGNQLFSPAPRDGSALAPTPPLPTVPGGDTSTINIYVAYTSAAAAASTGIAAEIQLAIATSNAIFAQSGINMQLNLVGSSQISYTEGTYTTSSNILSRFTSNGDGVMDTIHTLRTANNADLVALIVENLYDACGIAWLYNGQPAYGFSVTQRSCATSNLSFPHEIGHNLGADHDRYVTSSTTNTYNYGYIDLTARTRTVMAYNDQCAAAGYTCTRLPYFSSPSLTYQGRSLGVARSSTTSADNVSRINQTVASIARYRTGSWSPLPENGWWWASTESGRGYSLEVQGSNVFFAFYSYASDGTPVWYVSTGAMNAANSYFNSMQQYSGGQTLNSTFRTATATSNPGWIQIYFTNERSGSIYFWTSTAGWSAAHPFNRFDITTNGAAAGAATGYPQAGWWWNASEPGRGFFVEAQDTSMFVSFYMYNDAGQATWYVASGAMISSSVFSGSVVSHFGGTPFTTSTFSGPTSAVVNGSVTIQFTSGSTAVMTLPNGSQVALTRFAF